MVQQSKINEIVERIVQKFNPEKVILFGSYASGKARDDSDVDLLIITETDLPKQRRSFEIQKSLIGSKIPMDILVYTQKEFETDTQEKYSFLYSAIKQSKILYERKG
jgi:uncharacterized protein